MFDYISLLAGEITVPRGGRGHLTKADIIIRARLTTDRDDLISGRRGTTYSN